MQDEEHRFYRALVELQRVEFIHTACHNERGCCWVLLGAVGCCWVPLGAAAVCAAAPMCATTIVVCAAVVVCAAAVAVCNNSRVCTLIQ